MVMTLIIIILILFRCGNGGKVVYGDPIVVHDTIEVKKNPISLSIESKPVKISSISYQTPPKITILNGIEVVTKSGEKVRTNKFEYIDSIPDGVIKSTILADTIYSRSLNYFRNVKETQITTTEKVIAFDNRTYLGLYTMFGNYGSVFTLEDYRWRSTGIEMINARNKWYWGASLGIGANHFKSETTTTITTDFDWAEQGCDCGITPNTTTNVRTTSQNSLIPEIGIKAGIKF